MTVVGKWTGREAAILRAAMRSSVRSFAEHLGIGVRTVANWEAKGVAIEPLPDMQAILDTALLHAGTEARERFAAAIEAPRVADPDGPAELHARLNRAATIVDAELVTLFEKQTQAFRLLDRRLGAGQLLAQTEAHVAQMTDVLTYALAGAHRSALSAVLAEAAALAGWQALDLGRPDRAWMSHQTARAAALESGDPAVLAHVSAQQAYVLLDIHRAADAVHQVTHARESAGTTVPADLLAWLWAAEGEVTACAGNETATRSALDHAAELLEDSETETLPYLALDEVHLTRWRGHCLARLGAEDAVDDLKLALEALDPSFVRAAAGVHCDLAAAHRTRKDHDAAREHALRAARLAGATLSVRQQRRVDQLAVM